MSHQLQSFPMEKSLVTESKTCFAKHWLTKYLITLELLNTVILSFVTSQLYIWIVDGKVEWIKYYLAINLISQLVSQFVMQHMQNTILKSVECEFVKKSVDKYDLMSHKSKVLKTPQLFREKMIDGMYAISLVLNWGLPTVFSLAGTICSVFWTFYQKSLLSELSIAVLICSMVYFKIIKKNNMHIPKQTKQDEKKINISVQKFN